MRELSAARVEGGLGARGHGGAPRYDPGGDLIRPEGYLTLGVRGGIAGGFATRRTASPKTTDPVASITSTFSPRRTTTSWSTVCLPRRRCSRWRRTRRERASRKSELTGGYFEDGFAGFSVAVKDSERFEETWGYVSFDAGDTATPFPRERCYDCHAEHGAADNVFTQFYPILRR